MYVGVIRDVPLVLEDENAAAGTLKKAVVNGCFVANATELEPECEFVFNILWRVDFGDGNEFSLPPVRLLVERNQSEHFGRRGYRIEMPKQQSKERNDGCYIRALQGITAVDFSRLTKRDKCF